MATRKKYASAPDNVQLRYAEFLLRNHEYSKHDTAPYGIRNRIWKQAIGKVC